jgi:hypothetical protein
MKTFFDVPTQVFWKNPDFGETDSIYDSETEYFVGIAYKDEIICACCGAIIHVDEVPEILEFESWANIAEEIAGGMAPEDLRKEE